MSSSERSEQNVVHHSQASPSMSLSTDGEASRLSFHSDSSLPKPPPRGFKRRRKKQGTARATTTAASSFAAARSSRNNNNTTNNNNAEDDSDDDEVPYTQALGPMMGRNYYTDTHKKNEPLRPGDVIEYTNPLYVCGHAAGRRVAQVLSTNPIVTSEYWLVLDNNELLPKDTNVRRIEEYKKGRLYVHRGIYREIENFRIKTAALKGSQGDLAGLRIVVDRMRTFLDSTKRDFEEAPDRMRQEKQDGLDDDDDGDSDSTSNSQVMTGLERVAKSREERVNTSLSEKSSSRALANRETFQTLKDSNSSSDSETHKHRARKQITAKAPIPPKKTSMEETSSSDDEARKLLAKKKTTTTTSSKGLTKKVSARLQGSRSYSGGMLGMIALGKANNSNRAPSGTFGAKKKTKLKVSSAQNALSREGIQLEDTASEDETKSQSSSSGSHSHSTDEIMGLTGGLIVNLGCQPPNEGEYLQQVKSRASTVVTKNNPSKQSNGFMSSSDEDVGVDADDELGFVNARHNRANGSLVTLGRSAVDTSVNASHSASVGSSSSLDLDSNGKENGTSKHLNAVTKRNVKQRLSPRAEWFEKRPIPQAAWFDARSSRRSSPPVARKASHNPNDSDGSSIGGGTKARATGLAEFDGSSSDHERTNRRRRKRKKKTSTSAASPARRSVFRPTGLEKECIIVDSSGSSDEKKPVQFSWQVPVRTACGADEYSSIQTSQSSADNAHKTPGSNRSLLSRVLPNAKLGSSSGSRGVGQLSLRQVPRSGPRLDD